MTCEFVTHSSSLFANFCVYCNPLLTIRNEYWLCAVVVILLVVRLYHYMVATVWCGQLRLSQPVQYRVASEYNEQWTDWK